MYEGNHYLHLWKPNQPQTRLVTDSPDKDSYLSDFIWVSSQWEFQIDDHGHFSFSRYRGYILVDKVNDLIDDTTAKLKRLKEEAEGESTGSNGSSSSSSSNSWDIDLRAVSEEEDEGDEGDNLGYNSEEEVDMAPKHRVLEKKGHRGRAFETDHRSYSCSSQSGKELAEEDSEGFRGRLIMMGAQLHRRRMPFMLVTSSDHPTWNAPALPVVPLDPPAVYSPILLIDLNEEGYANQLVEEEESDNVVVALTDELTGGKGVGPWELKAWKPRGKICLKSSLFEYFS
ncbi:hypothetical protein Acr_00g0100300 [Actinidia rufa]|uniref:Uncharacterized protein n=1 Tax=Actinidia rufa TaxID=165716 RepID=A0A7J0DZR4_9ERIC|nr:hypothetical protein Acr_00g0100300 [Actinidia rufa]